MFLFDFFSFQKGSYEYYPNNKSKSKKSKKLTNFKMNENKMNENKKPPVFNKNELRKLRKNLRITIPPYDN